MRILLTRCMKQSKQLFNYSQTDLERKLIINTLDDNIKKIIKEQVKEQVKAQVTKILPKIEKTVNEQLEAERILCWIITNRGSKRRRARKEPESTSAPKEKTSKTTGKSTEGSKSHQKSADKPAQAEEPMQTAKDLEEPAHQEFETGVTEDQPNEETSQLPGWFQKPAKPPTPDCDWNKTLHDAHGPLKVDTLTPELLVGPTFELMKGSCKSLVELEYFFEEVYKETTDQLDWNNPEGWQYPHDLRKPLPLIPNSRATKTKAADYGHIKWIEDLVPNTMWSQVLVSYDKYALWGISHWGIIAVIKLQIVEWHNYKHRDLIAVRRDDGKLYTFKEGDFNRLRIQDIEDMLLLLDQGKLTNLTVEERLAFNVSLRMFTRSVVIQRRMEDLQLGGGNKDKKNRLMCIDELHKFSDSTLNDVRTALDDRLKGIRMKYLPQTIWRQSDRDKAGAMIQAIDKQLKTRRIMRSLEKFVGGRPYEDKMDSMHSTLGMYYDYDAHVKGELLVMMKNSQSVNLLIFISNTLIELSMILASIVLGVTRSSHHWPLIPLIIESLFLTVGLDLGHTDCQRGIRVSEAFVLLVFDTSAGNPVKEILLKLNLPDHRILKDGGEVKEFQRSFRHSDTERLSRSDEVLKLKNFKKDATLKLFKSTNQERYEHVGPEVTRSHGGKIYKMAKRDYAWLMISRCSRSHSRQAKEQAQDLKSMITTSNHKIND
ncbi:hypothetical protein Tco_0127793 [Tanacetum coccineum]